jgi:hypothetical protein
MGPFRFPEIRTSEKTDEMGWVIDIPACSSPQIQHQVTVVYGNGAMRVQDVRKWCTKL